MALSPWNFSWYPHLYILSHFPIFLLFLRHDWIFLKDILKKSLRYCFLDYKILERHKVPLIVGWPTNLVCLDWGVSWNAGLSMLKLGLRKFGHPISMSSRMPKPCLSLVFSNICPISVGKEKLVMLSFDRNKDDPVSPSSHSCLILSHIYFYFLGIYLASFKLDSVYIRWDLWTGHMLIFFVSVLKVLEDNYPWMLSCFLMVWTFLSKEHWHTWLKEHWMKSMLKGDVGT